MPASISSRIASRPKIAHIARSFNKAGLIPYSCILNQYDKVTEDAISSFQRCLDEEEKAQVRPLIDSATVYYDNAWNNAKSGSLPASSQEIASASWNPLRRYPEHGLTHTVSPDVSSQESAHSGVNELEDPESQGMGASATLFRLQKQLSLLLDNSALRRLVTTLFERQHWPRVRQLEHLRSKGVSHSWLWHIMPSEGTVMDEQSYILAVRKRLGCQFYAEPVQCKLCGQLLDTRAFHAECCAIGEATKGHYNVVRKVVDGICLADSSVRTEVRGLSEHSDVRPADIFTNAALPGREAALDITIVSPEAAHAGQDCLQTAFVEKFRKYRQILGELSGQGIGFRPVVWSTEGAPHPVATRMLAYVCCQATRRNGISGDDKMFSRWQRELATALQVRKAKMIAACTPQHKAHQVWLLSGDVSWEAPRFQ